MTQYNYKTFRVLLDGREQARFKGSVNDGAMSECWGYLHRHTSCSVLHATRFEGYAIQGQDADGEWHTVPVE